MDYYKGVFLAVAKRGDEERLVKRCTSWSWGNVHGLKDLVLVKEAFLARYLLKRRKVLVVSGVPKRDDENATNPPPVPPTPQAPHTLSTIKLHILKKGEYDIWAMKIEHYLGHTDYHIWEVIQKGSGLVQVSTDTNGQIRVLPPKTAEEFLARGREKKARTTLLMAIPEDHLAKFHKITNAKEIWEAIKSRFEGLHKGYDRFQSLLSQLETHGVGVFTKDVNQKFLRSLPSSWSQVSLIITTKPRVDTLSFDDLYNNLRVFESDVKGSTASFSSTQNEGSSLYTDELMYSFFANQSSGPQLDHEDLEQVDEFDLEEMDLKWQVAMISTRLKKFCKKIGRKLHFDVKEPVGFVKTKVECVNYHNTGHFARECISKGNQESSDPEVTSCSKECKNTYAKLKNLYDEQKEQLCVASIEIQAYTLALKKKLLSEAEKEELKTKLENFQSSSKGLSQLLNSQMSAKDKSGLCRSSDVEDSHVNDRFAKVKGMHAVPPPMTWIYIPPISDFGIDKSKFTYGLKQSKNSESDAKTSDLASCESNSSVETLEYVHKPVESKPKAVSEPKV
uniref:Uncharacterized protein n=1 Tax=Tanacetum cinerariifolium TaxID=118510 RepID=A0A6L2N8N8_TANCI|nr:hypothetical protein [Tanacetum cinerariifolium]